ncbi:MAG: exo-alpha-sialidase [Tessaracoccus sp.]|uniref:sialidase family protein n=1 Tax=Tessaracoccus sp. TaxID=1971211 RepID=UPI001EC1CAC4|nr:sialidase family protein [Tessaracoccus sp.]MBK7820881.1 exo-alpha-sialidase [Tessaracoccus sp.]
MPSRGPDVEIFSLARVGDVVEGAAFERTCPRIPALCVTPTGRVIAAWDVRADWRDLPGAFDIAYRVSDDDGRTWGAVRILRRHEGAHGFGDASLIADPATGRLHCWCVGSRGESYFSAEPGREGLSLWLSTSEDDGETWTHRDLTALRPADVGGMFAASGNGCALASGRLLQGFVLRVDDQNYTAIGRSDDGGDTWALGPRMGPDCDENKVLPLADGSVLLHARARPRRRWAVSTDGGETFGEPVPHDALIDPACNGGLATWGDLTVATLLDDEHERRRLTLRLSFDDGRTWPGQALLDAGPCAYSVAAELSDGAFGVLWEAGDYEELLFARIPAGGAADVVARGGPAGAATPPMVGVV